MESHALEMDTAVTALGTDQKLERNEVLSAESTQNDVPYQYNKIQGFATAKGPSYEWKISALLFLRGLKSGQEFELATNVAGVDAMDDIVFRFKTMEDPDEWVTCFIQAKHKENSTTTLSLNDLKNPKGAFSLAKYLKSYDEIKKSMSAANKHGLLSGKIENSWFVIFTNAKGSDDLGKPSEKDGRVEKFLWTNQGKNFSNKDGTGFASAVEDCLGDANGKEFLSRLILFCDQPDEKELDEVIKNELRHSKVASNRSSELPVLFLFFKEAVREWFESPGKALVLNRESDILEKANSRTLVEICSLCERIVYQMRSEMKYNNDVISQLQSKIEGHSLVHIVPSEQTFKLSCTKVIQAVEKKGYYFFGFESLVRYRQQILNEWKNPKNEKKTIVICINNSECIDDEKASSFFIEIRSSQVQIILLADNNNCLVAKISRDMAKNCLKLTDSFQALQLDEKSLTTISCDISFKLQGYWTKLGNFPDVTADSKNHNSATLGLEAPLLVDIIENNSRLSIGSPLPESVQYYVTRTMDQLTVLKSNDLFKVQILPESIVIKHATMAYVQSILEKLLINPEQINESLKKYSQKILSHDKRVFVGNNFNLGRFSCNFLGFRSLYNQESLVPALRIRLVNQSVISEEASFKWFLFTFDHCTEQQETILSNLHEVKHFLQLENNVLKWTNSIGDIRTIRGYIDETQVMPIVNPERATCVDDRRVVLLCAEPGIGKSTLMTRMAKKTKEAHPNLWVICLSLNDQTDLFASGMHNDACSFLIAASGIDDKSVSLFKTALEITGNVVVLLDGFDEIAPRYITECCTLLTNIIQTKAHKIWLTSRNSMKDRLEIHLSTLAATLRKFNEDDQRRFLKRYWLNKSTKSESALNVFISDLIKITSQTLRDQERDFMGIPLQTKIMAEVFEDFVTTPPNAEAPLLPRKLDLLELLEKFVDKKLRVYYETKCKINPNRVGFDRQISNMSTKEFYEGHKLASLILILRDSEIKQLHSKTIFEDAKLFFEDIKSSEEKTGIIDGVINGKPRFVHRVFAEFFMAQWLAENLQANLTFLKEKLFTPEYTVTLNFFDRILAKNHCLHKAVLNANPDEVRRLLIEGVDLLEKDAGGRTALHLAANLGSSNNKSLNDANMKILKLLIDSTPENLQVKDSILLGTPLRYADDVEWWSAIDILMSCDDFGKYLVKTKLKCKDGSMWRAIVTEDLVTLLKFCLENGLTENPDAFKQACEFGSYRVLQILLERGDDFD